MDISGQFAKSAKITACALASLVLLAGSAFAQGDEYTLEETVMQALKANPSIASSKANAEAAEESRKSARGAFGPKLSTSYGYTNTEHDSTLSTHDQFAWSVNASQTLFTGFTVLSTYQKAALQKESAEIATNATELALILNVQENFINLLIARENLRSAQDTVERLKSQLNVAQAFYDVGLNPRIDVLRAEVSLSTAEDELLQAENTVATQKARLNTLLNLPLDAEIHYMGDLEVIPFTQPLDASLQEAAKNRPDILIARKAIEIAAKDLKLSNAALYPQITASAKWATAGKNPDAAGFGDKKDTNFVGMTSGVTASWELFSWGTTYYASQAAKRVITKLRADEANKWQEALFAIKSRHLSIAEATKRIKVAQKTKEQAEEAYRMATARYQAQVGTNTDVLDAQADLSAAEASLTKAQGDYMIAVARLNNAVGRKNPSLAM